MGDRTDDCHENKYTRHQIFLSKRHPFSRTILNLKLFEKTDVVLIKKSDVGYICFHGNRPFYPPSKGKAFVSGRVNFASREYFRVNHAGSPKLQPTSFTESTT